MELVTKLGRSQYGVPSANTIFRSFRSGSLRDSRPKPCRQEPWSKSSGNNSGANWAHSSTNARRRSASCQIPSYCWRIMGMTICLAPRGACGGGVFRSRFTCRVFGRASILASPSLERRRMTKMPPDGYPALQYLQSVRVSYFQGWASLEEVQAHLEKQKLIALKSQETDQGHRIKIGGLGRMANSAFGGKLNLCGTCSHLFTMFMVYLVVDNKYNVYVR